MALSFSRSMRALNADTFRPALVGLIVAGALVFIWLVWFLFASVPVTLTSQGAQVQPDGKIAAEFAPGTKDRFKPGQPAQVRYEVASGRPGEAFGAVVWRVTTTPNGRVRVELYPREDKTTAARSKLHEGSAQVEIPVEYVSPATMLMRASGQFFGSP